MKIVKQSASVLQMLNYATIKDLEDYIIVTCPINSSIEVKGKFIHIRPKEKTKRMKMAGGEE